MKVWSLLVVVFVVVICAEGKRARSFADLRHSFTNELHLEAAAVTYPPWQYFNQSVDHFNLIDSRTFSQRYVVNDTFWDGTGPVFFMLGGESTLSRNTVYGWQMALWGAGFKALLVALEHRFFGSSQPFADVSTESLEYFNLDQVLADAATFTQLIRNQYNAHNSQFIVFGGSYAGTLASYFRTKYPHLVDAAVASSATVEPIGDYYQYLEVVTETLATLGSKKCIKNIQLATDIIQPLTYTESGRQNLTTLFDTCLPIIPEDIPNFMQYLAFWFMSTVQYNLQFEGTNVTTLCDIMTNDSQDPLTNYIEVWNIFSGGECIDVSLASYVADLNDTSIFNDGSRQFYWMTCFIQGFFETSDSYKQVFGNLFPLESLTQICPMIFSGNNYSPADIAWTKLNYGGNKPAVTKVLYVNGDKDPWYRASITRAPRHAGYDTIFIHGASHCADMFAAQPYSPPALLPAQHKIRKQLKEWIREYNLL